MKRSFLALFGVVAACGAVPSPEAAEDTEAFNFGNQVLNLPAGCDAPRGIIDAGYSDFRVNADVNGDKVPDYCRFVGTAPNIFLSCQFGCAAGNYGTPYAYSSVSPIDRGYPDRPRWLRDINGDGRADFCRWVGSAPNLFFSCDLAGTTGFDPSQYGVSLPYNTEPFTLKIERIEKSDEALPESVENRPVYVHFAITNNLPYAQAGWVGAQVYPKHDAPYTNPWGEWQLPRIAPGQTLRGVAEIDAPRSDPGVSVKTYFVADRKLQGEFALIDGDHLAESTTVSFDVAARYQISMDTLTVWIQRSYNRIIGTDTDYAGLKVMVDGRSIFDNSGNPKFLGNIGGGDLPIALSTPSFDLPPTGSSIVDIVWTVLNDGGANSAPKVTQQIMNGVSSAAAGVLGILYPGTGSSWAKVDDFVHWINSLQFAGCDGPVAMDHLSMTSNVISYKTFDDSTRYHDFTDLRLYDWDGTDPAYNSQAGCGDSPRQRVKWTLHRLSSPTEVEVASPMEGLVKPNGTFQFYANDPDVRWSVEGDAVTVGWIDEQTGLYHAPASLRSDQLIVIRVTSSDNQKHGVVFVTLDPR